MSAENAAAIDIWQRLDVWGRGLDTFGGVPMPLRIADMNAECDRAENPEGMRWRVQMIEEIIFAARLKRHRREEEERRREKGKK